MSPLTEVNDEHAMMRFEFIEAGGLLRTSTRPTFTLFRLFLRLLLLLLLLRLLLLLLLRVFRAYVICMSIRPEGKSCGLVRPPWSVLF